MFPRAGQHPLGRLDQHPAVQRGLQLFGQDCLLVQIRFVQQPDGRHVHHGLSDRDGVRLEADLLVGEQVERTDHLPA